MNYMRGGALLQGITLVVALGFLAAFLQAPQEVARMQKEKQIAVERNAVTEGESTKNVFPKIETQFAAAAAAGAKVEGELAGGGEKEIAVEVIGEPSEACSDEAHTIVNSIKESSKDIEPKIEVEIRPGPLNADSKSSVAGEITWYTVDGELVTIQCEAVGIAVIQCKDKEGYNERAACAGNVLAKLLGGDPGEYADVARGVMEGIEQSKALTNGILSAFAEDAEKMVGELKKTLEAGGTAEELASLSEKINLTEKSIAAAGLMKDLSESALESLGKALGTAKTLASEVGTKIESLKDKTTTWDNSDTSGNGYGDGSTFGGGGASSGGGGGLGNLFQGVLGKLFGQGQGKTAEEQKKQAEQEKQKEDKNKVCKEKYPGTSYVEKNNRCECPRGQDFIDNTCQKPEDNTKPVEKKVQAQISCAPLLQDDGFPVAIAYACTHATQASADGFELEEDKLAGSATPTLSVGDTSSAPRMQTYALTCTEGSNTDIARCSVSANYPFAVLVANPSEVERGQKVNFGWITGGMDSTNEACEVREKTTNTTDVALFSKTGRSGVVTTPPLENDVTAVLRCVTKAGNIKETEVTVKVL